MLARALIIVFQHPQYIGIAGVVSFIILAVALLASNVALLAQLLKDPSVSIGETLGVALQLLGSIQTNFSVLSGTYIVLTALLFGVNVSLFVYYTRRRAQAYAGVGTSTLGLGAGILGIGCASCGSLILTSLLGVFGLGGFLAVLPLGGGEFGILAVALLAYGTYILARKVHNPLTCEIE